MPRHINIPGWIAPPGWQGPAAVRRQATAADRPRPVSTVVPGVKKAPGPVPDQEAEPGGALPQVQQQVPGLLHCPCAVRVGGHAQDTDMPTAQFDHEEHVDAAQGDCAVDVEEVARQHRGGPGAQELPPGGVVALRRGRDPQPLQHPPHRRRRNPVAEAEQLGLDRW